jgi:hypothetical protein
MLIKKSILLSVLIIIGLLAYFAERMQPVPYGDAEDYWEFACGIELNAFDGYFPYARRTGVFPKTDGWYFYYFQEHHGRHIYRVTEESLIKTVHEVFPLLNIEITKSAQKNLRERELGEKNMRRKECHKLMADIKGNDTQFIEKVNIERSSASNHLGGEREIASFKIQWERAKIYWVSVVFESVFLCFWWIFTFHKGAFGKLNEKFSIRLAFFPLILFIPHYLGYAPYLFSSGPSGGILYPLFAIMLVALPFGWVPFNLIDIWILELLPQPLMYISQGPASPLALSFHSGVSPTVLIIYAILILASNKLWRKYVKKEKS